MTQQLCDKCGYGRHMHAFDCPAQSPEQMLSMLKYMHGMQARYSQRAKRYLEMVTLWQGKFAIVKHENNQLRKRLSRQESSDVD